MDLMYMTEAARQKAFTFSYFMTTAVIVTCFPLYFDSLGFSKVQVGLLYSAGPLVGIASNLFWGMLSDRYQALKKILNIVFGGQLLMVLSLSGTRSFPVLMALMIGFFFFQTPTSSLNDSLTLHTVRRTGLSYASFRVFGSYGFAFAALVFGFLLKQFGSRAAIFLPVATVALSLCLSFLLPNAKAAVKRLQFAGAFRVIASRRLLVFLAAVLLVSIAHRINDGFLALFLRNLGASETMIGVSWTISAISEIPVFYLLSRYGDRFKDLPLLAFASLIYVLRYIIMGTIDHPAWVLATQLMHSLSFGIYYITAVRYLHHLVPDEYRATGQAVFAVVWSSSAGLIGGAIGGWLFDVRGGHALYFFAAFMAFLAFAAFLSMHLLRREH